MEEIERWRKGLEAGGLRVNFGKTKVMRCEIGAGQVKSSGSSLICVECVRRESVEIQYYAQNVKSGYTENVAILRRD